jgi:arylsulfatase A-like enzyme
MASCRFSVPIVAVYAAAVGSALAGGASEGASGPARPNVVLIVSDDQHWHDYGFMGHAHLRTPNLDRLARESLVFPRGYVTSSLCCPSLASIITGRYPHEHRIVGNDPPDTPGSPRQSPQGKRAFTAGRERMNAHLDEWPTLPRLLGATGYRSLQTGKWWQGEYARGGFDEGMTKGERHGDEGLAIGRGTMAPIHDFIGRCRAAGTPFFVWYAPMLPHDPHDPPQELVDHYAAHTDSLHVARYWGNVERFDRTVGDLLDQLDAAGLSRDTLVVYVTDNGWIQDPESKRFAPRSKLSPYDGGLRTPIMLRWPGTIAPRTSAALASAIDIAPTVLAACGAKPPAGLPGVDLLDDAAVAGRTQVFGECYTHTIVDLDDPAASLLWRWTVQDRWKLIVPAAPAAGKLFPAWQGRHVDDVSRGKFERGEAELFDVVADPDEQVDLAGEHADVVARLRADLDRWWTPAAERAEAISTSAVPRRPNLLVFLADDLGARDLGCTGSGFYRTPAVDALAATGMTFTQAYAAAPVCSPTRAALMTGRFPARVRITNFIGGERRGALLPADSLRALPAEETTIAARLAAVGFSTGIFGKWHLGPPTEVRAHGFAASGSIDVAPGRGPDDDPHHARAIARQAVAFIAASRGGPFFCYVPLHSVHVPLRSTPDLVATERRRAEARKPAGPREIPEGDRTARAVQDHPVYAAMIQEMDEAVSTVLAALEEQDLVDDTLVVFTSDNGGLSTAEGAPTSNLPLRAGKGYLYEGGIRVPLVVRWPGVVPPGARCDVPVTTLDVSATLLDAGGAAAEPPLDGTSLRPLLSGTGGLPPRDLIWHYPHYSNQGGRPATALVAGDSPAGQREKLVEHFEDGRVELFDLAADEGEQHDLAGARPQRAAELRGRLEAWRKEVGAAMPVQNPTPVDPFGPEGLPPKRKPAAAGG